MPPVLDLVTAAAAPREHHVAWGCYKKDLMDMPQNFELPIVTRISASVLAAFLPPVNFNPKAPWANVGQRKRNTLEVDCRESAIDGGGKGGNNPKDA